MADSFKTATGKRVRITESLPEALNHNLCRYEKAAAGRTGTNGCFHVSAAIAISTAGLAVLALPQLSEARIIYTPANQTVNEQQRRLKIDFNHDGVFDASIGVAVYCRTSFTFNYCFASIAAHGSPPNGVMASSQRQFASAAKLGHVIGSDAANLFEPGLRMASCAALFTSQFGTLSATSHGPWRDVRARYLGFKFERDGLTYYGWARMNVSGFPCAPVGTLTGYAFETIPGKPIRAGQERDPAEALSEPSGASEIPDGRKDVDPRPAGLGLLAIGAGGLLIWRKQTN